MKTLVLCDDYWHSVWVPREGLSRLKDQGFTFDWIENAHDWSAERMAANGRRWTRRSFNTWA
jgi:hypothetical protein